MEMTAQPAVSSLEDADTLYSCRDGKLYAVSFSKLMTEVRNRLGLSNAAAISLTGEEWVRIAKTDSGTACCVLAVSHGWNAGRPVALVAVVNASTSNRDGCFAEQITKDAWFAPNEQYNLGLSFTSMRFVKEGSTLFVEVRFKNDSKASILYSALGANVNMELVTPVKSTAAAADIWKTVSFGGG